MNPKSSTALLLGGVLALGGGVVTAARVSSTTTTARPAAAAHMASRPTQRSPQASASPPLNMASSVSPAASTKTPVAAPPALPHKVVPSTPATPAGTTLLQVAAGSGAGCTAGVTEGNQWIKYTVHPGDTLSSIAQCFSLNGYQTLYKDNLSVLGPNPNLIYPGQVITIVNGKMSVSSS